MPTLPTPAPGTTLGGGDLPVTDAGDVLAAFPAVHRVPAEAPVRDALTESFAAGYIEYQSAAERAAALCDPRRSTGDYLKSLASEREVVPRVGESEASLRNRLFAAPEIVTPQAIKDAVDSVVLEFSTTPSEIFEPGLDCWFVNNGDANWDSFIGANPSYPDRLYLDDAALNDGVYIPGNRPGGAIASNHSTRSFFVRIPQLFNADNNIPYIGETFFFQNDAADDSWNAFISIDDLTEEDLYNNIISAVESIKGQGMTWTLIVDPTLGA